MFGMTGYRWQDSGMSARWNGIPDAGASDYAPELISPDGRHVAYSSSEGGMHTVYVAQFPDGQGKWQVPVAGISWCPRWSPKGDRLYVADEMGDILERDGLFAAVLEVLTPQNLCI